MLEKIYGVYFGRSKMVCRARQGCQMAKFDPFLSLDCAMVQSKERKGSNFVAEP